MQPNNGDNQMRSVMDIQKPTVSAPPSPRPQPQPQPAPNIISPSGSMNRPATMEYTRPRPGNPNSPSFAPMQQPNLSESPKPKKSKKGLIIALFVVLFIGLVGAGAGYYLLTNKKQPEAPVPVAETEPTEAPSDKIEATPEGVDKTLEQVDQSLNSVDDAQDFTSNDIADTSLGM